MRITEKQLRQIIRETLIREAEAITVGDVKKALEYAKGKKMKDAVIAMTKEAGKKAGMFGIKSVLSFIPGAGAIASGIEAGMEMKDLYSAAMSTKPEDKKDNPLWDYLTIDPDTSGIVDDAVEARFIKDLADRIAALSDDVTLPDADEQLNSWLKGEFGGTHMAK